MAPIGTRKKTAVQLDQEIAEAAPAALLGDRIRSVTNYVRQAIVTRYAGPTDSSGSRVIASCEAKRIMVPWDHALDAQQNHAAAALQLMDRLGWSAYSSLVMGGTKDGYVFVQVDKRR